jgi:hypothetical protein
VVADRHARVRGPALGHALAVPLDEIVEPEARAAHVAAARVDREPVVEAGRVHVLRVRLEGQRVDALLAQPRVAAPEATQVLDPRHLEPDDVRGVMGDALRVRFRKSHSNLVAEVVVAHRP